MVDKKLKGFTMAEVLITLGIIGIIAAMTFPILLGKYQKVVTVNQLKKAYSVLSQMVLLSQEHNGAANFDSYAMVDSGVVETFLNTYWLPYFNSPTVCKDGIFPYPDGQPYKSISGVTQGMGVATQFASGRFYFTSNDGTAYFVNMMRWEEVFDDDGNQLPSIAKYSSQQDVYVDLNGIKEPNTYGKDVFKFVVFFDESTVKPAGYNFAATVINNNCKISGVGDYCAAKIMNDGWQIKNDYPWR